MNLIVPDRERAREHYKELSERDFFERLLDDFTSGDLVAMVWRGPQAIAQARHIIGATNPLNASPGTIRGDFSLDITRNTIHGADSESSARREISLWFAKDNHLANGLCARYLNREVSREL